MFELAGEDCAGLLADVTHLLTTNGCNVRSAAVRRPAAQAAPFCTRAGWSSSVSAGCWILNPSLLGAQVWTYHGRVAFVLSVTEKGQPIADSVKLQRLRQILFSLMDHNGEGIVNIKRVRPCCRSAQHVSDCSSVEASTAPRGSAAHHAALRVYTLRLLWWVLPRALCRQPSRRTARAAESQA